MAVYRTYLETEQWFSLQPAPTERSRPRGVLASGWVVIGGFTLLTLAWVFYHAVVQPYWLTQLPAWVKEFIQLLEMSALLTLLAVWGILIWQNLRPQTPAVPPLPTERFLGTRFTPAFTQMFMMLPALIRGLGRDKRPAPGGTLAALEDARVCTYIARHQNPTGNLFGAINTTVMAILTYVALGITTADDRLRRAIDDLKQWRRETDDALEFVTFDSRVWNTALLVTALRHGGVSLEDPDLCRAVDYLITHQSFWPLPRDWQNPGLFTPRTGGWPFQDRNPLAADCDSTSEVLQALGHLQPGVTRVQRTIDAGLRWLYGMQSAYGGWPAFARGQRGKARGPFPISALDPPSTLVDTLKMMIEPPILSSATQLIYILIEPF